MTKSELLANIHRDRAQLDALIASVPRDRMTAPVLEGDRSVKDVIAHISAWQKICMALVRNNTPVESPPPGASGPSTDLINQRIYEGSRDRPLEDVVADAQRSYGELLAMIDGLSDDALVAVLGAEQEAAQLTDTESAQVGRLISGNSDEHYREHIAQIERWLSRAQ
jgi:hypothetical protein